MLFYDANFAHLAKQPLNRLPFSAIADLKDGADCYFIANLSLSILRDLIKGLPRSIITEVKELYCKIIAELPDSTSISSVEGCDKAATAKGSLD